MIALSLLCVSLAAEPTDAAVAAIRNVGREGSGQAEAAAAVRQLAGLGETAVAPTLKAFAGASPAAKNWLRMAVAEIVQADAKLNQRAMVKPFRAIVTDTTFAPDARAVAFDYLLRNDREFAKSLLPKFLDDPSVDLRRLAIEDRLSAKPGTEDLKTLFAATRDQDQAERIGKMLDEAGVKTNLTQHFGYLTDWHVVGPFDSTDGAGFAKAYAPETTVDLKASYDGKAGAKLAWKKVSTAAKYGMVNLNTEIGKHMDSAAYATAAVSIAKETPCEIRVGSKNAVRIFLNGTKLFEREAYHHGFAMDQHVAVGTLKAGANRIVLKVVQNNQKESWAQDWAFNLRVCDSTGGLLPLTVIPE